MYRYRLIAIGDIDVVTPLSHGWSGNCGLTNRSPAMIGMSASSISNNNCEAENCLRLSNVLLFGWEKEIIDSSDSAHAT